MCNAQHLPEIPLQILLKNARDELENRDLARESRFRHPF